MAVVAIYYCDAVGWSLLVDSSVYLLFFVAAELGKTEGIDEL